MTLSSRWFLIYPRVRPTYIKMYSLGLAVRICARPDSSVKLVTPGVYGPIKYGFKAVKYSYRGARGQPRTRGPAADETKTMTVTLPHHACVRQSKRRQHRAPPSARSTGVRLPPTCAPASSGCYSLVSAAGARHARVHTDRRGNVDEVRTRGGIGVRT